MCTDLEARSVDAIRMEHGEKNLTVIFSHLDGLS